MVAYTKQSDLIGKTTIYASVGVRHKLDDPHRPGNLGLEGFDEEQITKDGFHSADDAKRWAEQYKAEPPAILGGIADVIVEKWHEYRFDDAEYGEIVDAEATMIERWNGYLVNDYEGDQLVGERWEWDSIEP